MLDNLSVVIETRDNGYRAYCPALKNCQSQGKTVDQVMTDIHRAIDRCIKALPEDERSNYHRIQRS